MQQDGRTEVMVLSSAAPFAHTGLLAPIVLPSFLLSTRSYLCSPPHQMGRRKHIVCLDPTLGLPITARIPSWTGPPSFRKCCCFSCSLCTIVLQLMSQLRQPRHTEYHQTISEGFKHLPKQSNTIVHQVPAQTE